MKPGEPLYLMIGKWGNRGDVLSLYTLNGDLVAKVKQSRVAFKQGARFDLYPGMRRLAYCTAFTGSISICIIFLNSNGG